MKAVETFPVAPQPPHTPCYHPYGLAILGVQWYSTVVFVCTHPSSVLPQPPSLPNWHSLHNIHILSHWMECPQCLSDQLKDTLSSVPSLSFFRRWFFPIIGHMGICTSTGVIRDFAGPYFVSVSSRLASLQWVPRLMWKTGLSYLRQLSSLPKAQENVGTRQSWHWPSALHQCLTPLPLLLPPGQARRAVWPEGFLSN